MYSKKQNGYCFINIFQRLKTKTKIYSQYRKDTENVNLIMYKYFVKQ